MNGDGHLNGLGTKKTARQRLSRKAEETAAAPCNSIEFKDHDADTVAAWLSRLSHKLDAGILALVGGLDDVEETADRLHELMTLRRYQQIWRKTSDSLFDQVRRAHDVAHEAAVKARDEIEEVSMDLFEHCSVLAVFRLEETGNLARLRELADEVTSLYYPSAVIHVEDDLQAGLEADVYVARSMHLLVVLQREARHIAKFAASVRAAQAALSVIGFKQDR